MTNMEKICKTPLNRENEINWQEVNLNNNTEEADCKEQKGCQAMKPKDLQLLQKQEHIRNHNENAEASNVLSDVMNESFNQVDLLTPNSNCSSANNSTDNLSYLSDGCVIEEVLILPSNLSDEEISINSDDCVYAYRGADFDVPDQRAIPLDDETDFLEMDFDPDPASEIEHVSELNNKSVDPECTYKNDATKPKLAEEFESDSKAESKQYSDIAVSNNVSVDKLQNGEKSEESLPETLARHTGAKPKKVCNMEKLNKLSKVAKYDEPYDFVINSKENATDIKETDESCLDCLEKEFLSKTIGKKMEPFQCSRCKCRITYDSYNHSSPYKNFGFNDLVLPMDNEGFAHRSYENKYSCDTIREENLLLMTKKETASFLNVEADEKTIVQALEKIDASFNRDMIRNYFASRRRTFADVPEFIIYMSKRNCDYKRMIKLIKSASNSELEIKFIPNNQTNKADVVQVSAFEILQCWSRKSDLGELKKLGKRFSQMNVLGKITNLIRQAQQRNANVLNEFISIPQYYETGYVTINKK